MHLILATFIEPCRDYLYRSVNELSVSCKLDVVYVRDVAATFGCHLATIYRLKTHHHLTVAVNERPCSGRPHLTSQRQDRHIRFVHLRERSRPATMTERATAGRHNNRISCSTVQRRLHNSGLRA